MAGAEPQALSHVRTPKDHRPTSIRGHRERLGSIFTHTLSFPWPSAHGSCLCLPSLTCPHTYRAESGASSGCPCPQASWRLSISPPGGSLIGMYLSPADNKAFIILFTACIPASGTGLVNSRCSLCVCGRHLCWRNIESKGAAS